MKLTSASNPFKTSLKSKTASTSSKNKVLEIDARPVKKKKRVVVEDDIPDYDIVEQRSPMLALAGSMTSSLPANIKTETLLDESDTEQNTDRYKNMRTNTNVMALPAVLSVQASQNKVRGLTTLFGQRADIILQLLESDSDTDGALTLLQRTLLQTMVDVLPVVERAVRTSRGQRGVYQLNQCISQIREITTDIQSLRDRGQLGAAVVERVLRPAYLDLAVQISLAVTTIDNDAKSYMDSEAHLRFRNEVLVDIKRTLATYVQSQYETVKAGVTSGLS